MNKAHMIEQEKPDDLLFFSEGVRSIGEMISLHFTLPMLRNAPRGDGHAVMVIPGFTADDESTKVLRNFLSDQGYNVYGWGLGVNIGARENLLKHCYERVEVLAKEHDEKITLIGQSLGGIYAREISKLSDNVRQVICLGSPVDRRRGDGSRISALYEFINRDYIDDDDSALIKQVAAAPTVPCSMIYSQQDGIVHWQTCRQEHAGETTENIQVYGSHSGMGFNPAIYYAIADRLAQAGEGWQAFKPPFWLSGLYPSRAH